MQQLPFERTIIALTAVAVIERAVELTAAYVRKRRAFSKGADRDTEHAQFKLAECQTVARVAQVFVDDCVRRLMDGTMDATTPSMAKWWTTEMQCPVVDEGCLHC
ncbi:MAG: acyl-CoA dehydrogenase, partial [Betaproteobacteria bacterium]|nr:acyl-CoA dehydrogenase [Betaproteobacteria bacterium]